mmetsp:Transcript_29160/g.53222  ORF Transcript_29160/g.53222 Transcript_29160/m.53222 type:complete len:101 (+) Transcript_29160:829-1131(+)
MPRNGEHHRNTRTAAFLYGEDRIKAAFSFSLTTSLPFIAIVIGPAGSELLGSRPLISRLCNPKKKYNCPRCSGGHDWASLALDLRGKAATDVLQTLTYTS